MILPYIYPQQIMLMAVLMPLVAFMLKPFTARTPNLRDGLAFLVGLITFALVLWLWSDFRQGIRPSITLWHILPGMSITFKLESAGMMFALVAAGLWPVTHLYAVGYMRANHEIRQTRFFSAFPIAIACALGIAFSANLFTTFIFYEIMTLCTYPLVTHKGNEAARQAGRTYLGVLMGTSLTLLLPAILWVWQVTGSMEYTQGGLFAGWQHGQSPFIMGLMLLFFVFGTAKAAVMPFHRWLPAAMIAPTPVSALLHAVAVVKAGIFIVFKVVVYIFGADYLDSLVVETPLISAWLPYLAGVTVIAASVIALQQDDLKKRLAYSTISQLSYIVMATGLLSPYALMGAVAHLVAHAVSKITLFFAAGNIYTASGKKMTKVSQMQGIGRLMPITMTAFAVGSLSLIGLPPTIGFVSKWFMVKGAMQEGHIFALLVFAISTLLNAAYLLPIVGQAFLAPPQNATQEAPHGEAPWPMLVAICISALLVLALFAMPWLLLDNLTSFLPEAWPEY